MVQSNVSAGLISLDAGADTLNFTSSSVSILGTTIKGATDADVVSLYGANDVVFDLASGDSIFGGTGADTFFFTGSVVSNSIQAGSGSDSIVMSGTGPSSAMSGNTIDLGVGSDTVKFATATNADTITVTSTTIAGAKSITYEEAATAAAITTGAGADVVIFEKALTTGGDIATHSGNDSIQFLKNAAVSKADLGAGADSLYGAQIISNSTISGGAGQDTFLISTLSNSSLFGGDAVDSISITGSLLGATIDPGAGNENFTSHRWRY